MPFYDDDEIWDEFQWEAHLSELEQQNEKIKGFIESTLNEKHEPRWIRMLDEYKSELDLMNAYIEEELLIEDSYFPDDDDWDDDEEEFDDPMFDFLDSEDDDLLGLNDSDELEYDEDDDEEGIWDLEGEEWKALSDEFALSDYGSIEKLDVYVNARDLGAEIFRLLDYRKDVLTREQVQQFVSDVIQISAKIAGGYAFGFELDVLGANIAYNKRALAFANQALNELQSLKNKKLFTKDDYAHLHGHLFELRNDIGVYIQELREHYNNSI